ncbi:MAG: zf-HC2 domain-containing protein [Ruminococcus sp.]|nr:zf-HC2 domain-containing protein [Ruminococcus sp.]
MKCNIIRDLLPLYCEGLASQESNEEIEKHLRDCSDCSEYYENMRINESRAIKPPEDIRPLKKVKKHSRLKSIVSALISAAIVCALFLVLFVGIIPVSRKHMNVDISVTDEELHSVSFDYLDENYEPSGNVQDKAEHVKMLNFEFELDRGILRAESDCDFEYNSDNTTTLHYHLRFYKALPLPFDRGNGKSFRWGATPKEGDTLTIHYAGKDLTYDLYELMLENDNK